MTYLHYSEAPLGELTNREQSAGMKPNGLWFEVDYAWRNWCAYEHYPLGKIVYRVTLNRDARIIRLANENQLRAFNLRYRADLRGDSIDWRCVAADAQGIIVPHYQWQHRFDMLWYYGWDCESGCVWDVSAIAKVELVAEPAREGGAA